MPAPQFRRNLLPRRSNSLLRLIFPKTRTRTRQRLLKLRHETIPHLKHRTQANIYKYILYRQALKLKPKRGILQRLRGATHRLAGSNYLENEARLRRQQIAKTETSERAMSYQDSYAPREPGQRRRKLAGYLKAANELRQTYTQQYAPNWSGARDAQYEYEDDTPGSFPDAAVVRSGEEEMILFPSYARKHVKKKPEVEPGTVQEVEGEGRDVRDSTGAGDAEFWKQQWNNYEADNAVVDVDVRGWIYSPHKGQMSRKQRLFIGLARQLVGVQAPAPTAGQSAETSRDPSPASHGFRERAQQRSAQHEEEAATREAEEILRKGEKEAAAAAKGAYSERPARNGQDDTALYRTESGNSVMTLGQMKGQHLHPSRSNNSMRDDESITSLQKRGSWNQPSEMSPAELAEANQRLMARLRHFLAIPMANTPISIFFYNEEISKQRTIYTDASGHFSISAALDFIPTHVRILASDKLSATEEVIVTDSKGISVISDIDDTIKHSAISSGAREIFRNAFIRDLSDLTIEGVKDWYNRMSEMGVKFHYVSNSPWQLYPVISRYFSLAGLPPGSFHLKQYSGMLQGIFEPVAERKKVTLDKISRDFPERNFILIGDSGEADLEVYTDFVVENPGRIVAVFIRDVTTTDEPGFFDPSMGSGPGDRSSMVSQQGGGGGSGGFASAEKRTQRISEHDDPELKAAIAASLREFEDEERRRSKSLFPTMDHDHPDLRPGLPARKPAVPAKTESVPNLIDLDSSSDDEPLPTPSFRRVNTDTKADFDAHRASVVSTASAKSAPPPPRKPIALRSATGDLSGSDPQSPASNKAPPPPKPRKSSAMVSQPSPLSQSNGSPTSQRPPVAPKPVLNRQNSNQSQSEQTYAGMARDKLWSVYNNLPALRSQEEAPSSSSSVDGDNGRKPPPPPPPRRGNRETAMGAASYVGSKASAAWQYAPAIPYHSRPQITSSQSSAPYSTTPPRQGINRANTASTVATQDPYGQYGTKREQLWRQRWAKAEEILHQHGVALISWRVGTDAIKDAERIIKEAEKRGGYGRKTSSGKSNENGSGNRSRFDDSK